MERLAFVNRVRELSRLRRALSRPGGALIVVYGRRRCGKSRLLQETLRAHDHAYYLADLSAASMQREAIAVEIGRIVPGFAVATYRDWAALLETWRLRAPAGAWLVLDELPYLTQSSPELPSVIQKLVDSEGAHPLRLILCGSSQRMMHGLVLDESAPLYGRAGGDHQGFPDAAACPARGSAARPGRQRRCLFHLGRGATQLGTRRGLRFDRRGCCRADPGPQRRAARGTTPHPPGRHGQPRPVQLLVGVRPQFVARG